MKKVLFVAAGYPDKNNRNRYIFSHELVTAISKNSTDIIVLDIKSSNTKSLVKEQYEGVTVYRCNLKIHKANVFKYFITLLNLYKIFLKIAHNYDNVLFSFINSSFYPLLPMFYGKNKIIISHGGDAMLRWNSISKRTIKKKFLAKLDYYVAVSDKTATYLEHYVPKEKVKNISVIYNGINKTKFLNCRKKSAIRESLHVSDSTFLLLSVCNLISRKGVDIILEADSLLKKEDFDFKHIIVGRGPEEEALKEYVQKNGLQENIQFISYIEDDNDLAELFVAADLYVMMSKTEHKQTAMEGFGIVYAEAQFVGVPVIAGKSGGVPSAMRDSFTGYLIDPDSEDASVQVKSRIAELYIDKGKYRFFSENSRRFVEEKLDWKIYAERLDRIFV